MRGSQELANAMMPHNSTVNKYYAKAYYSKRFLHTALVNLLFIVALGWMMDNYVILLGFLVTATKFFSIYYVLKKRPMISMSTVGIVVYYHLNPLRYVPSIFYIRDVDSYSTNKKYVLLNSHSGKQAKIMVSCLTDEDREQFVRNLNNKQVVSASEFRRQ